MKLLYLHDGRSQYDHLFIDALRDQFDLVFFTFSEEGYEAMSSKGIQCLRGTPDSSRMAFAMLKTCNRVSFLKSLKVDYDVALAAWATTYGYYAASARILPYGLIAWGSDVLLQPKYPLIGGWARKAVRMSSTVFVDSNAQREAVKKLGAQNIVQFPRIDLTFLKELEIIPRTQTRRSLGISDDTFVVLFNRSHEKTYRPLDAIAGFAGFAAAHPQSQLVIANQGRLTNGMEQAVQAAGLQDRVKFVGRLSRESLMSIVASSDVYLSTSSSDGTSASLIEAMYYGVVPLVSNIEGNREWIAGQDTNVGLLFPVGDTSAISKHLADLYQDRKTLTEIGMNARKFVIKRIDWGSSSRLFIEAVKRIAEQKI